MTDDAAPPYGIAALAIDSSDPPAIAGWWQQLIGGEVEIDSDGDARLRAPDGLILDFLKVPEAKTVKNRLHLDLSTAGVAEATEHALRLGATRADDVYSGGRWQVLRDPEGNEFCLLGPPA